MRYARHLVLRGANSVRSSAVNREEHEMLNLLCECIGSNVTRPVFVTSLSAEKNELSQWRAYGGSSGSFALGFNSERLVAAIAKNTDTRFNLYKCIYDEAYSASLCRQFVDSTPGLGRMGEAACLSSGRDATGHASERREESIFNRCGKGCCKHPSLFARRPLSGTWTVLLID